MKYVADHETSRNALKTWAGDKNLILAKHFFWTSDGSSMQTTLERMLRTLLYSIICSEPSLIQCVPPDTWADQKKNLKRGGWRGGELSDALQLVIRCVAHEKNFCFFVDGLDEHKG